MGLSGIETLTPPAFLEAAPYRARASRAAGLPQGERRGFGSIVRPRPAPATILPSTSIHRPKRRQARDTAPSDTSCRIAELLTSVPRTRTGGTSIISKYRRNSRSVLIVPLPRYPKLKFPPTHTECALNV